MLLAHIAWCVFVYAHAFHSRGCIHYFTCTYTCTSIYKRIQYTRSTLHSHPAHTCTGTYIPLFNKYLHMWFWGHFTSFSRDYACTCLVCEYLCNHRPSRQIHKIKVQYIQRFVQLRYMRLSWSISTIAPLSITIRKTISNSCLVVKTRSACEYHYKCSFLA